MLQALPITSNIWLHDIVVVVATNAPKSVQFYALLFFIISQHIFLSRNDVFSSSDYVV